ncbi:MAG: carbohydrate kinase [Eubacteriales bacterium]
MDKKLDVVAFGELLIDFTQSGSTEEGIRRFDENPGGAPGNMAVAVAKLGREVAFVGKVGADLQGDLLLQTLSDNKVKVEGIIRDKNFFTTLAFVQINENGERKFSFARKPGADTQITVEELDTEMLQSAKVFHFGSLSLTEEPSRGTTWAAAKCAKEAGAIISYDPNYRNLLWDSEEAAMEQMRSVVGLVDVMKISDEETALLTGAESPEEASQILLDQGVKVVVVTLGGEGAFVRTKEGTLKVPGYKVQPVDTTGAGDSFWGGFIYNIVGAGKAIEDITLEELGTFVKFGNALASLCVEKRGGIPAMPELIEVEARLEKM